MKYRYVLLKQVVDYLKYTYNIYKNNDDSCADDKGVSYSGAKDVFTTYDTHHPVKWTVLEVHNHEGHDLIRCMTSLDLFGMISLQVE
jgi:hypothetical protein